MSAASGNPYGRAPAIAIADDHDLVRIGLVQLLRAWNPAVELGEAADAASLDALLASRRVWDLVVVDLVMPGFDGEHGVRMLLAQYPRLPILVLSGSGDSAAMGRLIAAGVAGYVPKSHDARAALSAIEHVLGGRRYLPPELRVADAAGPTTHTAADDDADAEMRGDPGAITPRQRETLALLQRGLPNKVIAARLGISEATVKMHVTALLRAYGVRSRAELLALGR
jgi:DNA-binding NarL/FixJ family response regulator